MTDGAEQKRPTPTHCRHCGAEMKVYDVRADCVKVYYYDSAGGCMAQLDTPFNDKGGLPNMARILECPNHVRRWWGDNAHDIIASYHGTLHWGAEVRMKK